MPTTKKPKNVTEDSAIADESAQESPELSKPSGQAMYDNACREIARLTSESTELHSSIDAKQSEIAEIRREIQQDEQAYEAAEHAKDESAQRITRQRTR